MDKGQMDESTCPTSLFLCVLSVLFFAARFCFCADPRARQTVATGPVFDLPVTVRVTVA